MENRTRTVRIASWHDDDVVGQLLSKRPSQQTDPASPTSPLSPASETCAESTARFAEPSQSLIFLDWDDTLFPTTDLFDRWGIPSRPDEWSTVELTEQQECGLERWREVLLTYLRTACSLSDRCVIVTNAQPGWIDKCISRFAPNLRAFFDRKGGPRVVYAREALKAVKNKTAPGSPRGNPSRYVDQKIEEEELHEQLTKAKFAAMRKEAKSFYSQYPEQTWKNIMSVGDARYEHDAAQELAFRRKSPEREKLRLKALITPEGPPLADLTYRLRLATALFPAYVQHDGDLDLDMNTPERLQAIADALDMPELRDIIPKTISEEDVAADMDEIVVLVQNHIAA